MKKLWILIGVAIIIVAFLNFDRQRGFASLFVTTDQQGQFQFNSQNYAESAKLFLDPQLQAAALYRAGEFKQAAGIFAGYDTADSNYNHGNALCMQGKYSDAIKRYERALELQPDWKDAQFNLEVAKVGAAKLDFSGGEMTGGKMAADDYVFSNKKNPDSSDGDETVEEAGAPMSDAEMRATWLRSVQTQPADFLRSKFMYQSAMEDSP